MKNKHLPASKLALIGLALLCLNACSGVADSQQVNGQQQSFSKAPINTDDSLTRSGELSAQDLISNYPKFNQSYQDFLPSVSDIENFKLLQDLDVVVFLGLWCHDSQREIPRLLKLVEQSDYPLKSLKLIALSPNKAVPAQYANKFKVSHTPTIFVLKNQQIIATIVEKPAGSITQDLLSQIFH